MKSKDWGFRISKKRKSFILKYRIGHGRKAIVKKKALEKFGIENNEQARVIAKEWLLIAVQGKDPCEENNDQTTMKEFCSIYLTRHADIKKKKSSATEDRRMIRLQIIPHFGKIRVKDLTRAMVVKRHEFLSKTPHNAIRFL